MGRALAGLVVLAVASSACSSAAKPTTPEPGGAQASDGLSNTPDGAGATAAPGAPTGSTPTTAGGARETLRAIALSGTAQDMLDLVGAARSVVLMGPSGDPGLSLDIEIEHRDDVRGEAWVLASNEPAIPGRPAPTEYTVVPVTVRVHASDGRIDETWTNAELATGEPHRVSLLHHQFGALQGALDFSAFERRDPPCSTLHASFDFRRTETRAVIAIQNEFNQRCAQWNTTELPTPWRTIERAP